MAFLEPALFKTGCEPVYRHCQLLLLQLEKTSSACMSAVWPARLEPTSLNATLQDNRKSFYPVALPHLPPPSPRQLLDTIVVAAAVMACLPLMQWALKHRYQPPPPRISSASLAEFCATTSDTTSTTARALTPNIFTGHLATACKAHQKCSEAKLLRNHGEENKLQLSPLSCTFPSPSLLLLPLTLPPSPPPPPSLTPIPPFFAATVFAKDTSIVIMHDPGTSIAANCTN
jgi:hypothetical protein